MSMNADFKNITIKATVFNIGRHLYRNNPILIPKNILPSTIFLLFIPRNEYKFITRVKFGCARFSHLITSHGS